MEFVSVEMSLPSRERGLKYKNIFVDYHTGNVAPLAGALIEIPVTVIVDETNQSLPSRERGLKFEYDEDALENLGRSPRGSAD